MPKYTFKSPIMTKKLLHHLGKMPAISTVYQSLFTGKAPWESLTTHHVNITPSLRQLTKFSIKRSDHRMFIHPDREIGGWNMMMPSQKPTETKKNPNTAFGHDEDLETYRLRTKSNTDKIIAVLKNNPDISIFVCQEAPINTDYDTFKAQLQAGLSDSWNIDRMYIEATSWGVVTLINLDKLQCNVSPVNLTQTIANPALQSRCLTVKLDNIDTKDKKHRFVTNLHLPHSAPEQACEQIITAALKHLIAQPNVNETEHIVCGDFNIEPEQLHAIIDKIMTVLSTEPEINGAENPVRIHFEYEYSPDGHLKYNKSTLSVDGSLKIYAQSSDQYEYDFKSTPFAEDSYVFSIMALIGGASLLFMKDKEKNNDKEEDAHRILGEDEACIQTVSAAKKVLDQLKKEHETTNNQIMPKFG